VKWADTSHRERLVEIARLDPDFGVRSRAAGALALTSNEQSRASDSAMLGRIVLDHGEDPLVRKACYEALYRIAYGKPLTLGDDADLDEDVDLDWVKDVC
jgi:hypothetical protein